jgi:uncharacterized protein with HEPN domain
MSKRDSILLLQDMWEAAQKIQRYTRDLDYEAFISDDRTVDAVVQMEQDSWIQEPHRS